MSTTKARRAPSPFPSKFNCRCHVCGGDIPRGASIVARHGGRRATYGHPACMYPQRFGGQVTVTVAPFKGLNGPHYIDGSISGSRIEGRFRYKATCRVCSRTIYPGDIAYWFPRTGGTEHYNCARRRNHPGGAS